MAEGAVVVDMAADSGGNCALTRAGEVVEHHGVHIVGMANPPSGMPTHASFLYARNVANVLALMGHDGSLAPDWDDEIVAACACCVTDGPVARGRRGGARRFREGGERPVIGYVPLLAQLGGRPARRIPDRVRTGRLRGDRGRLQGSEHPPYAADVRLQRHPRIVLVGALAIMGEAQARRS